MTGCNRLTTMHFRLNCNAHRLSTYLYHADETSRLDYNPSNSRLDTIYGSANDARACSQAAAARLGLPGILRSNMQGQRQYVRQAAFAWPQPPCGLNPMRKPLLAALILFSLN